MDRQANLQAVAALDEPTRRRLYEYVVAAAEPVSRDDAAAALAIPRNTAAFHLDKLAAEGLLAVVHARRTGRTGPGAGRPAKLYRRSDAEIEISLPERQYAVAGHLLAGAIEDADSSGGSARQALARRARAYGEALPGQSVDEVLASQGFEPHPEGDTIALSNCPFRALAKEYPALVCTMTLHLVEGALAARPAAGLQAELHPTPDHCCVRLLPHPAA
ncbi:transcriptional regulator [Kribbella sp. ALI-6-A]|uniref:helix-turn-helix transcriptional regulator n=1 Tax=Kribbella sp. ALI-6-A TaxID=1933817 RepID=UPI00097C971E|nr:helix-turn-helix domain-containing protein [Kribbella sp. ALI-6-A]ONI69968.1 transcriptional regulator [Kribbella sp. ALI-6-A]